MGMSITPKRSPSDYPPGYQGRPGYWTDEVHRLYLRAEMMEVDELEQLLSTAVRDERPDHPDLPPAHRLRPPAVPLRRVLG